MVRSEPDSTQQTHVVLTLWKGRNVVQALHNFVATLFPSRQYYSYQLTINKQYQLMKIIRGIGQPMIY